MTDFTPGTLELFQENPGEDHDYELYIADQPGPPVHVCKLIDEGLGDPTCKANAKRLAAGWNAVAGVKNPWPRMVIELANTFGDMLEAARQGPWSPAILDRAETLLSRIELLPPPAKYCCPKCGSTELEVEIRTMLPLLQLDDAPLQAQVSPDEDGLYPVRDEATTRCTECDHDGTLEEFLPRRPTGSPLLNQPYTIGRVDGKEFVGPGGILLSRLTFPSLEAAQVFQRLLHDQEGLRRGDYYLDQAKAED